MDRSRRRSSYSFAKPDCHCSAPDASSSFAACTAPPGLIQHPDPTGRNVPKRLACVNGNDAPTRDPRRWFDGIFLVADHPRRLLRLFDRYRFYTVSATRTYTFVAVENSCTVGAS